jgi:hypothetical protein
MGTGFRVLPSKIFNFEVYNRLDGRWDKWQIQKSILPGETDEAARRRAEFDLRGMLQEKAEMMDNKVAEVLQQNPEHEVKKGVYDYSTVRFVDHVDGKQFSM